MNKHVITALTALASLVLALVLLYLGQPQAIALTAAITLLTATLWVSEALPIPVTSLIPFVALQPGDCEHWTSPMP